MRVSDVRERITAGLALVLLVILSSCAGGQPQTVATSVPSGKDVVTVEASSYKFSPNRIERRGEGKLTLEVKNVSSHDHNLTVKNPRGEILKSVDLPPNQTVPVSISLPEAGTYEFYCDKPFHSSLGMKGSIVVLAARAGS